MLVYVLNSSGKPLMPTQRFGKVRRMLKNKQAVIVNYEPFVIQLTYETTNYVQEVTLGVDTGSIHVGLSATTEKRELYASETNLRSKHIKKNIDNRHEKRRERRYRKRYRKPRFDNRIKSHKKGWIAPSLYHRIASHIRIIKMVSDFLPINRYIIETGKFDTQKLSNLNISGLEYQNGQATGFDNIKAFVKFRDKNTCKQCKGKSGNKKIEVHHLQPVSKGGSNRPDNLVCLCHMCHTQYHNGTLKLKNFSLNRTNAKSLSDAAAMNIIKDKIFNIIKEIYSNKDVIRTYGYITYYDRKKYKVLKTHVNDAFIITKNFSATPLNYYFKGFQIRRHNRKIYKDKIGKGGHLKRHQAEHIVYGFILYDRVIYDGKIYFVNGRRKKNGYFSLVDENQKVIFNSIHYSKLKKISHEKNLIYKCIIK